jgi:hypothetical protein
MYQQPQGQINNQGMFQQQPPKPRSNPEYQQNFQSPGRQQQPDPFNDEATFEPQSGGAPSYQQTPNPAYSNDEYYNYGNVNMGTNNSPQFEQQSMDYEQQQEDSFEIQQPAQSTVSPSASHAQKTDLDLEIEKYQREIEEKQRKMRVQGQAAPQQQMPPSPPQPIQQQRPPMPGSHQQNQRAAEQDYDVYNIELSSYPPMNQPPTQRQAPVQQSENDEDMYFTSVDTDRQKKPIRKPVNPRTQSQKGFLSKFFNGNNREMP